MKQIRSRIHSVNSTLHITKAMQLVASSKIKKAQTMLSGASAFADAMGECIAAMNCRDTAHSIYFMPSKVNITCYIVIMGDRGMAGGYNSNIVKLLPRVPDENIRVLPIGKRAVDYVTRHGYSVISDKYISSEKIQPDDFAEISSSVHRLYLEGKCDRVVILRTRSESVLQQTATEEQLLPLVSNQEKHEYILFEPGIDAVLTEAVEKYLAASVSSSVRESFLAELHARRNAMDSASNNAEEMIDRLNLIYNRARQSTITQEITEIVAGADA